MKDERYPCCHDNMVHVVQDSFYYVCLTCGHYYIHFGDVYRSMWIEHVIQTLEIIAQHEKNLTGYISEINYLRGYR